jgi:hypothetical protein
MPETADHDGAVLTDSKLVRGAATACAGSEYRSSAFQMRSWTMH